MNIIFKFPWNEIISMNKESMVLTTSKFRSVRALFIKERLIMKLSSFFVEDFSSLPLLFVGLDPAQNTAGLKMQ